LFRWVFFEPDDCDPSAGTVWVALDFAPARSWWVHLAVNSFRFGIHDIDCVIQVIPK
jgi:hypothetical protein